ncbi:MAG: helix-hairpin-helix domain-containing protein [Bacteroidales bacterium]|nr:helix-hairpin-helix domain-containing protein [Bacteroidales bacterium]
MRLMFSKQERNGIISLTILVIVLFLFSRLYDSRSSVRYDLAAFEKEIERFEREQRRLADSAAAAKAASRSSFPSHYEQQYPQKEKFKSSSVANSGDTGFRRRQNIIRYEIVKLDINSCDSADLVVVPQFGAKRASKLVEYRSKLGGFHDFEQVREVFVLQNVEISHLEKYFYIDRGKIRKLHINTASYKELVSHPYFDAYLAKMILNYRDKHGKINSLDELRKCTNAYPELIVKLSPYVAFD